MEFVWFYFVDPSGAFATAAALETLPGLGARRLGLPAVAQGRRPRPTGAAGRRDPDVDADTDADADADARRQHGQVGRAARRQQPHQDARRPLAVGQHRPADPPRGGQSARRLGPRRLKRRWRRRRRRRRSLPRHQFHRRRRRRRGRRALLRPSPEDAQSDGLEPAGVGGVVVGSDETRLRPAPSGGGGGVGGGGQDAARRQTAQPPRRGQELAGTGPFERRCADVGAAGGRRPDAGAGRALPQGGAPPGAPVARQERRNAADRHRK